MKIVKKLNNNVVIGIDSNNTEVILFGKGIGFEKIPYELTDLTKIDRTYYGIHEKYYKLFNEIDNDFINYIDHLLDIVKAKIPGDWDPYVPLVLSDHINFSISRQKQGIKFDFPYSYELELEKPEFVKAAKWIVKNVNKRMNVVLEKGEITCIAMHLIAGVQGEKTIKEESLADKCERILKEVNKTIESFYDIKLDKKSINYYRFRHHIQFFVRRKEMREEFDDGNEVLFESMKDTFPKAYECVCLIEKYLIKEYKQPCSRDELLYLMIHINRLYSKEDCNRKGITPKEM